MKLNVAILCLLMGFLSGFASAQTAPDSSAAPTTQLPKEEKVEGVWALTGYLGKKLVKEFSNRLNLEENASNSAPQPVKVTISVGPFRVERTESR